MRLIFLSLFLLWSEGQTKQSAGQVMQSAQPPARCTVYLDFGDKVGQQVTVLGDKVKGPDFNVTREGDVWYGFVVEKPTRFKVDEDSIGGTVAGMDLMLHFQRKGTHLEISGLVGIRRVKAQLWADRIVVQASGSLQVASSAHLLLENRSGNRLTGQFGQGANISPAKMETDGCSLEYIADSPALAVLLFFWWLGA